MYSPVLFLFDRSGDGLVLLEAGDPPRLPSPGDLEKFRDSVALSGKVVRSGENSDMWARLAPNAPTPSGLIPHNRRELATMMGQDLFIRSGIAFQMMNLTLKNKFCGVCGAEMRDHDQDRARECPTCNNIAYPSLYPAVIVAVEKDGMLLMGHNVNFPSGRYSVLAGFVEPGETLEQAIGREVMEEAQVKIKNIRYFASQPWPFPASFMFGFNADWESGEPTADGVELSDLKWVTPNTLPDLPPSESIARKLINDWLRRRGVIPI